MCARFCVARAQRNEDHADSIKDAVFYVDCSAIEVLVSFFRPSVIVMQKI